MWLLNEVIVLFSNQNGSQPQQPLHARIGGTNEYIQDTAENTLIVSIEETTNTSKTRYAKHTDVFHERRRPRLANEGKTTLKGSIAELGGLLRRNHLAGLGVSRVERKDTLQDGNDTERK